MNNIKNRNMKVVIVRTGRQSMVLVSGLWTVLNSIFLTQISSTEYFLTCLNI